MVYSEYPHAEYCVSALLSLNPLDLGAPITSFVLLNVNELANIL